MTKHRAHGSPEHYQSRVYKMLRVWQKKLLMNNNPIEAEFTTKGRHNILLRPNLYELWLVGGGAGGSGCLRIGGWGYALGGTGGYLHVRFRVHKTTTATIIVGDGGDSAVKQNAEASGVSGEDSAIEGIENVSIIAGGGRRSKTAPDGSYGWRITFGLGGANTLLGVEEILENNPNGRPQSPSATGQGTGTPRIATYEPNSNYSADPTKGCGGDIGWSGNTGTTTKGGVGYAKIKSID